MKTFISIMALLAVAASFVYAETYTTEEFIVEGQPTTRTPVCGNTVTQTTTCTVPATTVVTPAGTTTTTTVVTTTGESSVYVGMTKYHLIEVMGQPAQTEKFKNFNRRQQGIYDEIYTYQTPTGPIVAYIKERRVVKVER